MLGKERAYLYGWLTMLVRRSHASCTGVTKHSSGHRLPQMRILCTLIADLSNARSALTRKTGIHGLKYWDLPFSVVVELGRTQLQARLQWKEGVCIFYIESRRPADMYKSIIRQSPVKILPGALV